MKNLKAGRKRRVIVDLEKRLDQLISSNAIASKESSQIEKMYLYLRFDDADPFATIHDTVDFLHKIEEKLNEVIQAVNQLKEEKAECGHVRRDCIGVGTMTSDWMCSDCGKVWIEERKTDS